MNIKKENNAIGTAPISVVNNFLHSIFKNIKVKIGSTVVSTDSDKYSYRAYLENLLGFNQDEKNNLLRGDFWFNDDSDFNFISLIVKFYNFLILFNYIAI